MKKKRMNSLRKKMKYPTLIFGSNVRYFTGVSDIRGPLLVTKDTEFLFSSDTELAETADAENLIKPKKRGLDELFKVLKEEKIKKIGVDLDSLPFNAHKKIHSRAKILDSGKLLKEMREVKDNEEVRAVRKSCALADKAMRIAASFMKKGITERKIRTNMLRVLDECEAQSFDFIVASGPNSLYTHYPPTSRRVKDKEFVIVDIGFKVDGYCSDITRTFCLRPTKEQKNLYSTVLESQRIALRDIRVNRKCKSPCVKIEKFFKKHNMRQYWKYGLGHGIGLDIHESPSLSLDSADRFRKGMVFTVEPGLHLPGVGGARIEDDFLMTKRGPQLLTKFPRRLVP